MPGKVRNLEKDFLQPLFHRWSSRQSRNSSARGHDPFKTERHIPHIKTFLQPSSSCNDNGIEWIVLTSHNFSMAAWGQLQKSSEQSRANAKVLFIRHWELGVFISPATLANKMDSTVDGSDACLTPYIGITQDNVINLDSDDEEKIETRSIQVPLPFNMNPLPYDGNDVPWATDRSSSIPDSFGCMMP